MPTSLSIPSPPLIVSLFIPPSRISAPSNPFIITLAVSEDLSIVSFEFVPSKVFVVCELEISVD